MGCADLESAVGCLAWLLRRRWGLTALRECARLKLERLAFVGRGAAAAAERRQSSIAVRASRARFYNEALFFSAAGDKRLEPMRSFCGFRS